MRLPVVTTPVPVMGTWMVTTFVSVALNAALSHTLLGYYLTLWLLDRNAPE